MLIKRKDSMYSAHQNRVMNFIKPIIEGCKENLDNPLRQNLDEKIDSILSMSQHFYDLIMDCPEEYHKIASSITLHNVSDKYDKLDEVSDIEKAFVNLLKNAHNVNETYKIQGSKFASTIKIATFNMISDIKQSVETKLKLIKQEKESCTEEVSKTSSGKRVSFEGEPGSSVSKGSVKKDPNILDNRR